LGFFPESKREYCLAVRPELGHLRTHGINNAEISIKPLISHVALSVISSASAKLLDSFQVWKISEKDTISSL